MNARTPSIDNGQKTGIGNHSSGGPLGWSLNAAKADIAIPKNHRTKKGRLKSSKYPLAARITIVNAIALTLYERMRYSNDFTLMFDV